MACDLTTGFERECKNKQGGQKSIYLLNFVENPFTLTNGEVTGINPLVTAVYKYELEGDLNTFAENFVPDRNTGTSVNTQTLTITLKGINAQKSEEFNKLAYSYPIAVAEDRNGLYHAIGIDDGIDFTIDSATGGAKTDLSGYTLTGVSTTGALSPKLDSATITALLALVA